MIGTKMMKNSYIPCDDREISSMEEQVSEGFGPYDKSLQYETVMHPLCRIKLNETDAGIMNILSLCPLLPTSAIVDYVGEEAYKRVKILFDSGYLARFSATNPETGFVRSVFFISTAYREVMKNPPKSFNNGILESMSYTGMLEVASISKWVAYALKYQPKKDVKLVSFMEKTRDHIYLEAVMEKNVNAKWFMKGTPCRFHVITCPKDDRMLAFLSQLYHFDSLVKEEEEHRPGSRSFVVIICQSIASMEHLAVELENMIYAKTRDELSAEHFLYSLETDGMIELGAFKFMHSITFPEMTIRHEQIAFR